MIKRLFSFLILFCFLVLPGASLYALTKIEQPHVTASLISEHDSVTPGVAESFALRLRPDPKWHVYWKYAGDSGSAPILNWEVGGQSVDVDIEWPTPERIRVGPFVNYGYSDDVIFLSNLPIPSDAKGEITVRLDAEWLVCEEECIPGNALFELSVPVVESGLPSPTEEKSLIEDFRKRLPSRAVSLDVNLQKATEDSFELAINPLHSETTSLTFFPAEPGIIENAAPQKLSIKENSAHLTLIRPKNLPTPKHISGLLVQEPPFSDDTVAKEFSIPFDAASLGENETSQTNTTAQVPSSEKSFSEFLLVLLAAFVGGLILNLMPCVFPVLSIKIFSFVKKAGKDPSKVRNHGLAFGGGILVSFWVLALVVRALREAGEKLGWGFQLQNPSFVAFLVLLLIAVALNLFGVFEIGSSVQRAAGDLDKDREGYSNSFLSGVLATLLATPCTAPFMGGAVAYGISSGLASSLLVFTMLAIGLAFPYLTLSFFPKLLASLPKPGQWMETFKELMGFPVLLTALWLLWVFEKQSSSDSLLALLLGIILFSFGLWIYGKICPPTANRRQQMMGVSTLFISFFLSAWIGIPLDTKPETASALSHSISIEAESEADAYGQQWYAFSPSLIEKLIAEKKPVYLDFTAAWCITCQVNKRVIFGSEAMRQTFREKGVVLVKGDWTNEDPTITEALEKFDRLGVPLNILYNPSIPSEPTVFPSVLTPQMVREELEKLS